MNVWHSDVLRSKKIKHRETSLFVFIIYYNIYIIILLLKDETQFLFREGKELARIPARIPRRPFGTGRGL